MLKVEPIRAEGDLGSYDEFDGEFPNESDLSYAIKGDYKEDMEEEFPF